MGSTLLQNMSVVSAGNISLISARQADTIYMICRVCVVWIWDMLPVNTKIIISIG
jgi:hypothetical protein